jgi:UDP-N-acetyl-D-mannosaminuronic acid transferase (WecB/TagA/CpsF family)
MAFDAKTIDQALASIVAQAGRRERFAYVVTPNVDHVVSLAREPARAALYERAWLTLNDSRVLEALASMSGVALPSVTGADLAAALFDHVIAPDEPVTIIGGDAAMIDALAARYGLGDIRWHAPPMGVRNHPIALAEAAAFAALQDARFTFYCVGAPQQEMIAWATAAHPRARGVGLCAAWGCNSFPAA